MQPSRLSIVSDTGGRQKGMPMLLCRCLCGNEVTVRKDHLTSGRTRSCGCLRGTHRLSNAPEYAVWEGMIQRCRNPASSAFFNYGGRGITVCRSWSKFENFYRDMGSRPSKRHSIDRIDGRRGYSPGNCRWALPAEQMRNTKRNRWLTADGKTKLLTDWACQLGLTVQGLLARLGGGWDLEEALTTPKLYGKRKAA